MKRLGNSKWLLSLGLVLLTGLLAAFPLWLDAPAGRTNKHDPKSPSFVPTNTPGPSGPATSTVSPTATRTSTVSPTPTVTVTPDWDGKDPADNVFGGAEMLGAPTLSLQQATLSDGGSVGDPADYYQFSLTNGNQYTFGVNILGGGGAPTVELRNSADSIVVASCGTPYSCLSSYTLAAGTGTYYVVVRSTGYVSYRLTYQDVTGSTPTFTFTPPPTNTVTPTMSPSPTVSNTPPITATFTATPTVSGPFKFEDFESAPLVGAYAYNDGVSTFSQSQSGADYYAGLFSNQILVSTSGGTWGAGGGHASNYALPTAGSKVDVTGKTIIRFWIKTDKKVSFAVSLKEDFLPYNENWTSPQQNIEPGGWSQVQIDLSAFTENMNNPDCAPNCASTDNNTFDLNQIINFDLQFIKIAETNGATVYIDDIYFDTGVANTPTVTNTPTTAAHGSLVMDYENLATNDYTLWLGELTTGIDPYGTTMVQNPWMAGSGTAGGPGGSTYMGCLSGSQAMDGPPDWPYAQHTLALVAGGGQTSGTGPVTDVLPFSPNKGVQFDYNVGAAGLGRTYRIAIIQGGGGPNAVTDYGHYCYDFTPVASGWNTMTIYFPDVATTAPKFAQPGWAAPKTWDPTIIGCLNFLPLPVGGSASNYDLCIDNVTFAVPVAPTGAPTPTPCTGQTLVFNGEAGTVCGPSFPGGTASDQKDAFGSTMLPQPLVVTAGGSNLTCGSTGNAACYAGSIFPDGPPDYPYTIINFELLPGGGAYTAPGVDITPYVPQKRLKIHYKANVGGFTFAVRLLTQGVADYGYYAYFITPGTIGSWVEQVIDMPDCAPCGPAVFAQPYGTPMPWATEILNVGAVQIGIIPQAGVSTPYDLCVDDIVFE